MEGVRGGKEGRSKGDVSGGGGEEKKPDRLGGKRSPRKNGNYCRRVGGEQFRV